YAQLVFQGVGDAGHRAREQDGVVFGGAPAGMGVAGFDRDAVNLVALQVGDGEGGQAAVDFYAGDLLRQLGQQGGLVTRAGADFKHAVGGLELEFLGKASLDLGRKHGFARVDRIDDQWQFDVGEGKTLHGGGNIALATDFKKCLQHPGVKDIPGTDLLLDHIESSAFDF